MVYIKREPGQIHKDNSYFNFIYDDDFLFASETKIHLTLYESWKVITFFLKWYIQIQKKKRDGKNNNNKHTNKIKLGSKNHGTKHIRQIFYLYKVKHKTIISVYTSVQPNFNSLVFKILAHSTNHSETLRQSRTMHIISVHTERCMFWHHF